VRCLFSLCGLVQQGCDCCSSRRHTQ
jgi:hypothetical protein